MGPNHGSTENQPPDDARDTNDRLSRAPADPFARESLGRYKLERELGRGGMGAVFQAHDPTLGRPIALKVILPEIASIPDARERFLREARAAAAVSNDHVVQIFDVGDEDGIIYLAMPMLDGETLEARLKREPFLPWSEVYRIARETATGLAAAHKKGFVHRDIKPGNIWLESPNSRVKILDFGLARPEVEASPLTGTGAILGTPHYMAPEQARGLPVDGRADQFSLGVMLYRMVTGRMPFHGSTTAAVLTSVAVDPPAPVIDLRADTPPKLVAIIDRLLAKERTQRFSKTPDLIAELEALEKSMPLSGSTVIEPAGGASDANTPWWSASGTTATGVPPSGPQPTMIEAGTTRASSANLTRPKSTPSDPSIARPPQKPRPAPEPIEEEASGGGKRGLVLFVIGVVFVGIVVGGWFAFDKYRGKARDKELDRLCKESEEACNDGRYREAFDLAEKAVKKDSGSALALVRRARARYFRGEEEASLVDCDEAIAKDPNLALAFAVRAPVRWLRSSPLEGVKDAEQSLKLEPRTGLGLTAKSLAKYRAESFGEAAGLADEASRLLQNDVEPARAKALALAGSKSSEARAQFDTMVRLAKDRPYYLVVRAEFLVQLSQSADNAKERDDLLASAEMDAVRANTLDPSSGLGHQALARVHAAREKSKEAIAACEKAVGASPALVAPYQIAAAILAKDKKYVEAIDWLKNGARNVPNSARLYHDMGAIYHKQSNFDAAIENLSEAIKINPDYRDAYQKRALAYSSRSKAGDDRLARVDEKRFDELSSK